MTYDIAVLPGDGIGGEVVDVAVRVLERAARHAVGELELRLETIDAGAGRWRRTGSALADADFELCRAADAMLLGAMGLPDARHPDGREAGSDVIFRLRFGLDLYAGIRPVKLYPGVPCPLRDPGGVDYVIVRENTEGLYAARSGGSRVEGEVASDTSIVTRAGTERIARRAFELARHRGGRHLVTSVDKANVLASYAFWRAVVEGVGEEFPDVALESAYVDAVALYLVQRPGTFDVLVAENMFGDILSDLGAGTIGGLGLSPSADIGDRHGLFQPAHGSAPHIAGRGTANPTATILSAAMMLEWLGRRRDDGAAVRAAAWIEAAVAAALADGSGLTRDLGGSAGTKAAGKAVLRALGTVVAAA
jgi:3-isopropylmalate dehydrogenase